MAKLNNALNGNQIQDAIIVDSHVKSDAAIAESKLALDYATTALNTRAVLTDADRTVADGINVSFPYILLRDTVNGKTYKLTTQNGTLVTEEV